jgi:hypothetical protein
MKPVFLFLALGLALLVQSCLVKSLHPFFAEKDVVFKPELLNTWTDQDSGKWIILPVKEKPNAYEMKFRKEEKEATFMVHLFKLEGEMYLDFLPLSSNTPSIDIFNLHLFPSHSVAKVTMISKDEVLIKWFNEEWLRTLFTQNRIKIAHEEILDEMAKDPDDKTYILTASTEELQKFLVKYGNEDAAFDGDNTVWLRLKKAI